MTGSATRRDLAHIAARGGWACSRGARFAGARVPKFRELHAMPRWPVQDEDGQTLVGMTALLLASQSALARLIDGARLRGYAALVGMSVLERILTWDRDATAAARDPLPLVDDLPDAARRLITQATSDAEPATRLAEAEMLLREIDAWPST